MCGVYEQSPRIGMERDHSTVLLHIVLSGSLLCDIIDVVNFEQCVLLFDSVVKNDVSKGTNNNCFILPFMV